MVLFVNSKGRYMYFKNFVITSLLLVFFTACNDNDSTLFTPPESHVEFLDNL